MDHPLSLRGLSRSHFLAERTMNVPRLLLAAAVALPGVLFANPAAAASITGVYSAQPVYLFGVPVDFILFGLTLLAVAVFHHKTFEVALTGLVAVTLYKFLFAGCGTAGLSRCHTSQAFSRCSPLLGGIPTLQTKSVLS
jgi:hypothetical protein